MADTAAAPVAPAAATAPAPATEPVVAAAPAAAPAVAPAPESPEEVKAKGFQKRIDAKTREVWEERRQRQALEQELATLRAAPPTAAAAPAPPVPAAPAATPVNIDALVNERATVLEREKTFAAKCNDIYAAGKKDVPDFDAAIQSFNVFGGLGAHRQMLEAVTALPEGHLILAHLGSNLDEAGRILSLPPVQQAIELTKLSGQMKSGPLVSGAPAPVTPVGGGSPAPEVRPDDKGDFKSQEDYKAWRAKQFKKR